MKKTSIRAFILALGVFAVAGIASKIDNFSIIANAANATQTGNNTGSSSGSTQTGNNTEEGSGSGQTGGNTSGGSTTTGSAVSGNLAVNVNWDAVTANIDAALQAGEDRDVVIVAGTKYTVPVDTLNVLAARGKVLMLLTGNGMALSISSEDIIAGKELNIDISANVTIPEDISKKVTDGADYCRAFSLNGDEALPFKVDVHFAVGSEYAGKMAVLYRYNEATGEMVPVGVFEVTDTGAAMFALRRGGEYIVVVSDEVPVIYGSYTVVAGDTLSKIAHKNNVSLSSLIEANPQLTNANKIYPGQVLNIQ